MKKIIFLAQDKGIQATMTKIEFSLFLNLRFPLFSILK